MYISTYIRNKNCHQHSYGFQNLMSSWGWGSKFSNLQQVGDFSFFGSKSSLLPGVILNQFSTKQPQCLMGRTDGTDGWDGDQKCLMGRMGRTDGTVIKSVLQFSS